jgi:hypothetical protein
MPGVECTTRRWTVDYTETRPRGNVIVRDYVGEPAEDVALKKAHFHCIELAKDGYLRVEHCWYPDTKTLTVVYHRLV